VQNTRKVKENEDDKETQGYPSLLYITQCLQIWILLVSARETKQYLDSEPSTSEAEARLGGYIN
jgi:hypothetical protein